ncbi:MAG: haloacid dehalogenase [Proteobacteria bacterium SG_bin9]|nr:MAG: haloacid dehalogenase [Proteobacteria bacterium SG_bin9]
MSPTAPVKVLLFDVFGTVVDWRSSLVTTFEPWGRRNGFSVDWSAFVDAWRAAYMPSLMELRKTAPQPFPTLDQLHRQSLDRMLVDGPLAQATTTDREFLVKAWHQLNGWPDARPALQRLNKRFVVAPLSNANTSLLVTLAKFAELEWDCVFGADMFQRYKPDRELYLGAARLLDVEPEQVMMVAAHNNDLRAARAYGLQTCFIPRRREFGPQQTVDLEAEENWTIVANDMLDLADRLGCYG